MSQRDFESLGELQRGVLEILWESGESSVREVHEALNEERALAYTTVLSTMQKLEKMGWLARRPSGRAHLYCPVRNRTEEAVGGMRRVLSDLFRGNRLEMFQHLVEEEPLSAEEIQSLQQLILESGEQTDAKGTKGESDAQS